MIDTRNKSATPLLSFLSLANKERILDHFEATVDVKQNENGFICTPCMRARSTKIWDIIEPPLMKGLLSLPFLMAVSISEIE
jgi:hypothetical protein